MRKQHCLSQAIRIGLLALSAGIMMDSALAQDDQDETELETIVVTGSRIKRADIEGALPVRVIDRAQIEASGEVSVAELMRSSTYASFGNFNPRSGSSGQNQADIDLRGLGSRRTLVLVDGRRIPSSPFAGSTTNLNTLPLAAVERIEILSDGASAIYGSDAIGGVVNVITRKDFQGAELTYGRGFTKVDGSDTEAGSAAFGAAGDRGRVMASASFDKRDISFARDMIGGDVRGSSVFANNYRLANAAGTGPTGAFIPFPGYACDDENFFFTNPGGAGNTCAYNFNAIAANAASSDNKSLVVSGEYEINDNWSTYLNSSVAMNSSFGRFAPVPAEVFVPENSPNDPVPGDGRGAFVRHRFAAAGNRDNTVDERATDLLIGFKGRIADRVDLEFGARLFEDQSYELGRNYIVRPIAEQYLTDGSYDLRDPFGNSQDILNAIKATVNRDGHWRSEEVFGSAAMDLFEMAGGASSVAFGAEWRSEDFKDQYDSLSEAGVVEGSAGNSSAGTRLARAAYFEWLFPISDNLEVTAAGRFDSYSDYGSDFSPKVAFRWQPLDSFTVRGSFGQGFAAPPLSYLSSGRSFSAESVIDLQSCLSFGRTDCAGNPQVQVDAFRIGNDQLDSELSDQYSLGFAADPFEWLELTLDYYRTQIENRIVSFAAQTIVDRSLDPTRGPIPAGLGVTRDPVTGGIVELLIGFGNEGDLKTDGLDLGLSTRFDFGNAGELRSNLQVSYVHSYTLNDGENLAGSFATPDIRAALQNTWSLGDFEVNAFSNFIRGTEPDSLHVAIGGLSTHDLQVAWNAPWNGKLALGVENLFDKYPSLDSRFDGQPYNTYLYDAYGRTPYFRYTQSF
ncbi:TonB-dependent receptor [Ahniella affigens]|uniref:TonB-dependent receptor n=1 Tax=Ahniella affigens TaxID=2021234 RepID=A0A2P1PXL0_9GAMM|nr:TonB-dependent receptor [Ahniella affigens]AVP99577.1 TonB-dependent receptor [Ahniella affigens]